MVIYYDSMTGNVERFVNKLRQNSNYTYIKIDNETKINEECHLITFTTGIGKVSYKTKIFFKNNIDKINLIKSVSSSGNMNWGPNFGLAADIISKKFNIPILIKFELSGTNNDINNFLNKIREITYEKK